MAREKEILGFSMVEGEPFRRVYGCGWLAVPSPMTSTHIFLQKQFGHPTTLEKVLQIILSANPLRKTNICTFPLHNKINVIKVTKR